MDTRLRDLVHRMLNAMIHKADVVFIPDPFDNNRGLMHADGTPGELLLPWKTTALMLAGHDYLGSMELPHGSENHIFTRDGCAIMIVWNDEPVDETVFLGHDMRLVELWSRSRKPSEDNFR